MLSFKKTNVCLLAVFGLKVIATLIIYCQNFALDMLFIITEIKELIYMKAYFYGNFFWNLVSLEIVLRKLISLKFYFRQKNVYST